jgi:hypothetical protein
MGKSNSIKLSIPKPCSRNWEGMAQNETGRFCDNCNKTVIDFTQYSDQQLADFFKRSKEHMCGTFRNDQLEKALYPLQSSPNRSLPQLLISVALTIGAGSNVYANDKQADKTEIHAVLNEKKEEEKNNLITGADTTHYVSWKIIDQVTKETLPGVTILIEGTTIATASDMNGSFKLFIPDHLVNNTIKLTVSSVGYVSQTVKCTTRDLPSLNAIIELSADKTLIICKEITTGYMTIRAPDKKKVSVGYKPTFRQKIKEWFRIKNK